MDKVRGLVAAVLLGFALAGPGHAQSGDKSLQGIKSVFVLVEDLDEAARQCGISADALDAAVRIPISNSRLGLSKESFGAYLYVNVVALRLNSGICAVNLQLRFTRWVWFAPNANPLDSAYGSVWDRGELRTGSSATIGRSVVESLEGLTKQFIGAWLKAN